MMAAEGLRTGWWFEDGARGLLDELDEICRKSKAKMTPRFLAQCQKGGSRSSLTWGDCGKSRFRQGRGCVTRKEIRLGHVEFAMPTGHRVQVSES